MKQRIESMQKDYPINDADKERILNEARAGGSKFNPGWPHIDVAPV